MVRSRSVGFSSRTEVRYLHHIPLSKVFGLLLKIAQVHSFKYTFGALLEIMLITPQRRTIFYSLKWPEHLLQHDSFKFL